MKGDALEICRNKQRYGSRSEAQAAIRGIITRTTRFRKRRNLHSYRCKFCGCFHVAG